MSVNMYGEQDPRGASRLLVPLTHRAIRTNGVPLPVGVMLAPANGGSIVEAAWRDVSDVTRRVGQWVELYVGAFLNVARRHRREDMVAEHLEDRNHATRAKGLRYACGCSTGCFEHEPDHLGTTDGRTGLAASPTAERLGAP